VPLEMGASFGFDYGHGDWWGVCDAFFCPLWSMLTASVGQSRAKVEVQPSAPSEPVCPVGEVARLGAPSEPLP
jgi:hypothetical protein